MARRRLQEVNKPHRSALHAAAGKFEKFNHASTVLTRVRAVPTIFIQYDHATKVGGLPIERFSLVHGPSNEGKTYFILGLIMSFLLSDHFAKLVDAERTTPISWVEEIMGHALAHSPAFFALRPETYEETVEEIRKWLNLITKLREEGDVPPNTSAIFVVDSIRKLVPANILKKITAETKDDKGKGIDGVGGRAAQMKAAMNAQWMDELVPLLEKAQAAAVVIARESEDPDADMWARKFGNAFKVGGGKALVYDSSLVMRIERASYVTNGKKGPEQKIYGERHRITIRKTKIAGRQEKMTQAYFHTSNGVLVPAGFDRARDVLELATSFGIVKSNKGWFSWNGKRWQGDKAVVKLTEDKSMLAQLEAETRAQFDKIKPVEFDEEGVES